MSVPIGCPCTVHTVPATAGRMAPSPRSRCGRAVVQERRLLPVHTADDLWPRGVLRGRTASDILTSVRARTMMPGMRTTLTLDADIADTLRERARLLDMSFKQVVNDTLRRGLSPAATDPPPAYRVVPNHSAFVPGIDPLKLNQINDRLEAEAFGLPRAP